MKIIIIITAALFLFISNAYSQEQISSKEAKDNIGKTIQVKGVVSNIYISEKGNTFINFDEKSPNHTFTVAVFAGKDIDVSKIKEGCTLTVYGTIKEYKNKPEIVIDTNDQIISIE